jgi:hypothetical protein
MFGVNAHIEAVRTAASVAVIFMATSPLFDWQIDCDRPADAGLAVNAACDVKEKLSPAVG